MRVLQVRGGMLLPGTRRIHGAVVSCAALLAGYLVVELTVRRLRLPDPHLVMAIEAELRAAAGSRAYFSRPAPVYGWDREDVRFPREDESTAGRFRPAVLFIGDSVTQGFGVAGEEAFPALVSVELAGAPGFQAVNAAVPGFGLDQMVLKLERIAPEYRPRSIVLAYIPHDLWRCGRNVNYGNTKPVLLPTGGGAWRIVPAPSLPRFYDGYRRAERRYGLALWSLRHIADNHRYYFYGWSADYYRRLFEAFRERLVSLAARQGAEVRVVRLASTWPGDALPLLDGIARTELGPGAPRYRFLDLEGCVRSAASREEIDYSEEFRWHPGPAGHRIYAECLREPLREALGLTPAAEAYHSPERGMRPAAGWPKWISQSAGPLSKVFLRRKTEVAGM